MSLATGLTFWDAMLPGLLIGLLMFAVLPWADRDNTIVRVLSVLACLAIMWRYLLWRIFQTLPPVDSSVDFAVGLVFLVVEVLCAIGTSISLVALTRTRSRTLEADRNMQWLERL